MFNLQFAGETTFIGLFKLFSNIVAVFIITK